MSLRRVAYVVNVFPKLSETFIAHELVELRRRGVEVRVISLRPPGEGPRHEFIARAGLEAVTSDEPREFATVLREFRPQLLHAHFATEPAAAARDLAASLGLPFTFTAHGYDIRRKAPADFAARAAAARAVVTVSHANARHIVETFGVPAKHLRIIPCGVDTSRFRPSADGPGPSPRTNQTGARNFLWQVQQKFVIDNPAEQRAAPCGITSPWIVCVARHAPVKNLGLLLDACALLRRRGVPFRCASVGDGPCRSELEAKRGQLGLRECVEFVGAADHDEVLRWWQRAGVAALTSESEGMPVSLMEAAACGVPAVATAVGGVPDLIQDGTTGLLSPPRDAEAFATALQRLLEDPALARKLGVAARRRAEERFSLARQVDDLMELWREVIA